jgi:hypothetical protein
MLGCVIQSRPLSPEPPWTGRGRHSPVLYVGRHLLWRDDHSKGQHSVILVRDQATPRKYTPGIYLKRDLLHGENESSPGTPYWSGSGLRREAVTASAVFYM